MPPEDWSGIDAGLDPAAWLADGRDPLDGIASIGARLTSCRLVDLDVELARDRVRIHSYDSNGVRVHRRDFALN